MDQQITLPVLSNEEQRVLGSLMEKSKTTPEYYPLTLNSLVAACNQKSARRPVVQYDDDTVVAALDSLRKKGLVATATGGSSRAIKYRHTLSVLYPIIPAEVAILCLLLLRGPLTVGEINSNSGRLYAFESLAEIQQYLEKLSQASELPAMVVQVPKKAGQKEIRYMHLFGGMPDFESKLFNEVSATATQDVEALETRLARVEQELAELKEAFEKLMKELY
ncbi:YceH family protein [Olivibacter sp. XZL3]|uniref:YceH family protein n=1 Tax=Olivibacter sp. XZL3 TaxID=1735116 RepID=UPI0010661C3E|nr:YceH family protein [Olivibacter sp. XZL3]